MPTCVSVFELRFFCVSLSLHPHTNTDVQQTVIIVCRYTLRVPEFTAVKASQQRREALRRQARRAEAEVVATHVFGRGGAT